MKFRIGVSEHTFKKLFVKYITSHRNIEKRQRDKKERDGKRQKRGYRERKIETATQKRQKEMERTRERKKGRETTDKTGNVSYISFFVFLMR